MLYLECFVDCLTLRECAERCKVSLRTAWLIRMRLIESLKRHLPRFFANAGETVQLDETYLRESFKDNHTRGEFRLLRPARHRGTPASKRGLSGEQICVMTGVADDDSAFLTVSGHGIISKNRAIAALDGRIAKGAGRPGRSLSRRHRDIGHRVHAHQGRRPRHQPRQHLAFPARRVHGRIPRREHQTAGRIPHMVPLAAHLPLGPRRGVGASGQRHGVRQPRARLGAHNTAVHGLLGRSGISVGTL